MCAWWVVLASTSPITAIAASSIPAKDMTLLGIYGGAMNTITVDEGHAYIGQGAMLVIMDVTDPTQPEPIGQSEPLPGDVKAIAIDQGYAYAALGYGGLAVLDMSSLATPRLVTVLDTLGSAEDVAVIGSHVLVASGLAGLRTFDISDPTQPTPSGAVNTPGFAHQLVVDGTTAYIADGIGGLRIVDVTTPATPAELGFLDTPEEITGVAAGNNFAYIIGLDSSSLRAIDVTDPAQPIEESIVNIDYSLSGVVLAGEHLYLRTGGLLKIFNSDPFLLNQVGSYWLGSAIPDVAVAGDYAFVAGGGSGLFVLDVNPPAEIEQVGRMPSLNQARRVAVRNNVAYVTDDYYGIAVLDVGQPLQITQKASISPCAEAWIQMTITGDTLVIDSHQLSFGYPTYPIDRRLCFYSLTDPLAPQWLGNRQAVINDWFSPRVAAQGNSIFVAEATSGATLLNPDDLTGAPLGLYTHPQVGIYSLAALPTGDRLLATTGSSLLLIDVSTPTTPQLLGELAGPYSSSINGSGDLVFAYNATTKQLDIVDIHIPASPQVLASIDLPGDNAKRILPVGNLIVIANGSAGARVIDVSTPTAPQEVAFYDPPADVSGLEVEGNRVYLAANDMGLMVVELDEAIQPRHWTLALPLLAH
ncbi:MAG: hypothetical protein IT328_06075 [Caldilineaceae bacterium]|nr:hypothetical protein [Caldilineaceae bacterium]